MPLHSHGARAGRLRRLAAVLAALLALPAAAAAQHCTEEPCGPLDFTPPTVSISPGTGTYAAGSLAVQISWSDDYSLDHGSRVVMLDGVNVTSQFTYSYPNNWTATSNGSVQVISGTRTLTATICDLAYNCTTQGATYTGPTAGVLVVPERDTIRAAAGSPQAARFRVVNTGSATTTYWLSTSQCSGVGTCTPSAVSVLVASQDTAMIDVSFTTPSAGTGQVKLTATAGTATSTGTVHVIALAAPDPGYPGDSLSLLGLERSACITVALGPGAAVECGDLRLVHGLPAVRELNRARAPQLLYNSQHADRFPMVSMEVTPAAGTAPDSIRAVLSVQGLPLTKRSWPGWANGSPRVVTVSPNANSLSTGVYQYTMEVSAHWNSGTSTALDTRTGHLVVVNRGLTPFGRGWWLSGLEQIHFSGDTVRLWVGGDGSTRLYRGLGAAGPWMADPFLRADTLRKVGTEYVRTVPGGAKVYFSSSGEHLRTVNPLGQATLFTWSLGTTGRLTRIDLPATADMPAPAHYLFEYNNNTNTVYPRLSRVRAPWLTGYRDIHVTTDASARVIAITDPYVGSAPPDTIPKVQFGYSGNLVISRTDRRGAVQEFAYGGRRLQLSRSFPAPGDTILLRITPAENRGLSAPREVGPYHAAWTGPRRVVDGMGQNVLWWVNRWGSPIVVREPRSTGVWNDTQIERGDSRWPGRVTKVVAPNGFTTTAVYDARGNVSSQTQWNPYGDNRHATTTYAWDPRWDAATQVRLPEGEVSLMGYDAYGRREWEQVGPTSTRRVNYAYFPLTHARAPGQLEKVTMPGGAIERYEYDTRGNLSATVSPMGARSEFVSDRLGRVTLGRTAIDTVAGVLRFQGDSTTHFDLSDRPLRAVSFGPAMNGAGAQWVVVENSYDREGSVLSVARTSDPDPYGIGTVTTRWVYDAVGRPILELAPDATPGNPNDNPRDSTVYDRSGNVVEVHTRRWDDAGQRVVLRMDYDVGNRLIRRRTGAVQYNARNQGIAQRGFIKAWEPEVNTNGVPPYPWYPNDGGTGYRIPADTARFTYDALGNVIRADNRDAWVRRSYYPNGALRGDTLKTRTVAELGSGGDSTSHVYGLLHTYDRNGRRTGLQHPAGIAPRVAGVLKDWTTWGYERTTGALTTVMDPLGNQFRYHHDVRGQVDSLYYPGGITDAYQYDLDGRMIRHRTLNSSTTGADRYSVATLRDETFRYDARGKLTFSGNTALARDTTKVWYTGLGQMVNDSVKSKGATIENAIPASTMTQVVVHDPLGNRGTAITSSTFRIGGYFQSQSSGATQRYQFGTGRQRAYQDNFRVDSLHYDGAGNQLFSTTVGWVPTAAELRDAAYFYGADGKLAAADVRNIADHTTEMSKYTRSFEEYRYDALGRRILVRSRRDCAQNERTALCEMGFVRRTVWDGDRELYEIQAWGGWFGLTGSWVEADTARPRQAVWSGHPMDTQVDPNPFLGRVAYTHGLSLDQPLGVVRMGYTSRLTYQNSTSTTRDFEPVAIVPFWNSRGQPALGAFADGTWRKCMWDNHCVNLGWPEMWAGYARPKWERSWWHGTLLEDKADASGLNYRRNRYYDPVNGRFTQEDPIGLAGGLNVYGFAAGDPVNYIDPFGLDTLTRRERRRLGNFCERVDCDKVEVHRGKDNPAMNRFRAAVLRASSGRAVTLGNHIFLGDRRTQKDFGTLAHEMTHVHQYQTGQRDVGGFLAPTLYLGRGGLERVRELVGDDPYVLPDPYATWSEMGMEQQGAVVQACFTGNRQACVQSIFTPRF